MIETMTYTKELMHQLKQQMYNFETGMTSFEKK